MPPYVLRYVLNYIINLKIIKFIIPEFIYTGEYHNNIKCILNRLYMQTKNINFHITDYKCILLFFAIFFLIGCNNKKEIFISGITMDTTYHVKLITHGTINQADIKKKIDLCLEAINRSMSTYINNSEISKFNKLNSTDEKFYISSEFMFVICLAEKIYKLSEGAWDGTIKPLIKLWGFDDQIKKKAIPSATEIKNLLLKTGFEYILIAEDNGYLKKRMGSITLDLASIAKGYAVDQVAGLIKSLNIENFLVEIGGEVYASGVRKDEKPWRVGINTPGKKALFDQIYKVVPLKNKALATSGDYRNYFEYNGKTYSHLLNPKTGYPVNSNIVSVSVIADTCGLADGLATAVMILDRSKGIELINSIDNTECLIITKDKNGKLTDYYSNGFL